MFGGGGWQGSWQAWGAVRNPARWKHQVQGRLGVERPLALCNTASLLAWQLLHSKFKVVLQMMPARLSRSHLHCLLVMNKNLPNLQPTVVAWPSLVYRADAVSWVIIFLKPFLFVYFCFLFCPCRKYAQALCPLSWAPRRSPRPPVSSPDGNVARVGFAVSFLTPGPPH